MNWRAIGKHIFLSPLYLFLIAALGFILYGALMGLFFLFQFVFLTGWFEFFVSVALVWALAIGMYLTDKIAND